MRVAHQESGLTVVVGGVPVPLDECGWFKRRACGCITAAVVAVVSGEGGWTIATADQAHRHFAPRKDTRERETKQGITYELITMSYYRENIGAQWECATHTVSEG